MFVFSKRNSTNYLLAEYDAKTYSDLTAFINNISNIDGVNHYNSLINDDLHEKLLARVIVTEFLKKYKDIADKEHHVLITASIHDKSYTITLGSFNIAQGDVGYMYDIVEN